MDQRGDAAALTSGNQAAFKPAGRAWSKPVGIGPRFDGVLTLDTKGDAIVVGLSGNRVQSTFRPFGGSWQQPVTIATGVKFAYYMELATDRRGDVLAAWVQNQVLRTAFKPANGRWRKPVAVRAHAPVYRLFEPALDKRGNATIVFWTASGLQASFRRTSRPWQQSIAVATYPPSGDDSVSLAVPPAGDPVVVWTEIRPINPLNCCITYVRASIESSPGVWQAPMTIGTGAFADVAYDSRGGALLIWVQDVGPGVGVVQARTFTQGG